MIDIALMGHGVVGSGVAEVLIKNAEHIAAKAKNEINIKYILDLRDFPGLSYSDKFIKDFNIILNDPDIRVVVEVMGGIDPAYTFVKSCLAAGKSVVTSNKELVAAKGAELLDIAERNNVNFLFEASVGGGIPVLRPIVQCLAGNNLDQIIGILNGTTNFILTKMIKEQMQFDDALALAQKLGYAERDPSADIDGPDACRKICILASLAFGSHIFPEQVSTEGIRKVTLRDVEYADSYNSVIKLIGRAKWLGNGQVVATVYPAFVSRKNMLSHVDDVFNAVMLHGDAIGDVLFYGRGAGKLPTASAVVADVIDCVKHLATRRYLSWEYGKENYVADPLHDEVRLFVRGSAVSRGAVLQEAEAKFGAVTLLTVEDMEDDEIAFITPRLQEKLLRDGIASLAGLTVRSTIHILD